MALYKRNVLMFILKRQITVMSRHVIVEDIHLLRLQVRMLIQELLPYRFLKQEQTVIIVMVMPGIRKKEEVIFGLIM